MFLEAIFHDLNVYDRHFNLREDALLTQVSVRASPDRTRLLQYACQGLTHLMDKL